MQRNREDQKKRDERGRNIERDQKKHYRGHDSELEHHQDADHFGWISHFMNSFASRF